MTLSRDAWSGLLFVAIGLFAVTIASSYEFGTARAMGPGYFPVALGGLIALLGAWLFAGAVLSPTAGEQPLRLGLRPVVLILASIVAFGVLIRPAGLLISVAAVVAIGRLAGPKARLIEIVVMAAVLSAICATLFVYGLEMPMRLFPWR
jgi:hypothetical protein